MEFMIDSFRLVPFCDGRLVNFHFQSTDGVEFKLIAAEFDLASLFFIVAGKRIAEPFSRKN